MSSPRGASRCHRARRVRLMGELALVLGLVVGGGLAALLESCSTEQTAQLDVSLVTDLVAGQEIALATITVNDELAPRAESPLFAGDRFVMPQHIGELGGLARGPLRVRIDLLDARGAVV